MKRMQAIVAAAIITAALGFGLLAVGVNAAMNTNSVPPSDSPASAAVATGVNADTTQQALEQINQLKSLIAQYQTQATQYQQQLAQANAQVQQLQNVLLQLQQAGVIRIQSNGSITLGRR